MDWPSFGYGAGVVTIVGWFWAWVWSKSPIRPLSRRRLFRRRTTAEVILAEQAKILQRREIVAHEARIEEQAQARREMEEGRLEMERALKLMRDYLHREQTQDLAWTNYQRRKKGLNPLKSTLDTPKVVEKRKWVGVPCACGHGSRVHRSVEPEECAWCPCSGFTAA
jgi:hypothetical protein